MHDAFTALVQKRTWKKMHPLSWIMQYNLHTRVEFLKFRNKWETKQSPVLIDEDTLSLN